jgi:primary-amine oxidase
MSCATPADCPQNVPYPPQCPSQISGLVPPFPINPTPSQPLDPLTPGEMCRAMQLAAADSRFPKDDPRTLYDRVELQQPPKAEVLAFRPGSPLVRKAFVAVYSPCHDQYFAAVINLTTATVESFNLVPGARPSWTNIDNTNCYRLVAENPEFLAALARRGIPASDMNADPLSSRVQLCIAVDGRLDNLNQCKCFCPCKKQPQRSECKSCTSDQPDLSTPPRPRAYYAMPFYLSYIPNATTPITNYYLQPIDGIMIWWNENASPCGTVIQVSDMGITPIVQGKINVNCPPNAYYTAYRGTATPLVSCLPQGVSYHFGKNPDGSDNVNEIFWEKWRFHWSLHPTWGLQFNQISFNDKNDPTAPDNYRSIIYQMNLSEIITAYGSPEAGIRHHNFLDLGEYQSRMYITPLQPGADVPPYAQMFSPVFASESGGFYQFINGLAIYEQYNGVLWRHYDVDNGIFQGRAARQLILTHTNTVGNYDYAFYWIFNQNGAIDVKVRLTGIDEYQGTKSATIQQGQDPFAPLVQPFLKGPNHQHIFNYRIDFDVDGVNNSIMEVNTKKVPAGPDNPCDNAWVVDSTMLSTEKEAKRDVDFLTSRSWMVVNPNSLNRQGYQKGYMLMPGATTLGLAGPCARITKRAHFIKHNFWATKYHEDQLYVMGKYPVEKPRDEGLPVYQANNESLDNTDIVTWYTMVMSHIPASEDYPILPYHEIGFMLSPYNFFNYNPSMDVDPNKWQCTKTCPSCSFIPTVCPD